MQACDFKIKLLDVNEIESIIQINSKNFYSYNTKYIRQHLKLNPNYHYQYILSIKIHSTFMNITLYFLFNNNKYSNSFILYLVSPNCIV